MSGSDTALKKRLIDVALELFTRNGYRDTSLRQIANRAGVSHGSVRYHFGSKDALYRATLERFAPEALGSHFPEIPESSEMTPARATELFREQVFTLATIKARVGESPHVAMSYIEGEGKLGGPPNPDFYKRVIKPGHDALKRTVQAMRPDITDDETLEILVFNVVAQCLMLRIGRGVILKRLGKRTLKPKDIDKIAQHIYEVALRGIEGLKP